MIQYVNGRFSEISIPNERALIINLVHENGLGLEPNLTTIFDSYKKHMSCICFYVDEEIDQHELVSICKKIHTAGLKTAFDTSLDEMSKINKRLLDELDYVRLTHSRQYKKDYSPFGDVEDWIDI